MLRKKIAMLSVLLAGTALAAEEKIIPIYFKQDPGIVIDGKLTHDDWGDIKSEMIFLPGRGKEGGGRSFTIKSPRDLSAAVKVAHRPDGLYFGVKVTDDKHRQKCAGGAAFKGDHVELLLDLQPTLAGEEKKFGEKQFQILFSPGSLDGKIKPEAFMYHPMKRNLPAVPVAALKTDTGYTLEALVPWKTFGLAATPAGKPEKLLGMDFLISDTDGEAPAQEKYLFAGKAPFAIQRGRLPLVYLSDSRGTLPSDLNASGRDVLVKKLLLDEKTPETTVTFEYTPVKGCVPVLFLTGHNLTSGRSYGGYADLLRITVNGKTLSGRMLRNKPNQVLLKNGRKYTFVSPAGKICLPYVKNISALPKFGEKHYIFRDLQSWCGFEFDLTGIVRPGSNTLTAATIPVGKAKKIYSVVIEEAAFALSASPRQTKKAAPTGELPIIAPAPVTATTARFTPSADSSVIGVALNGENYSVVSRWSVPEGRFVTGSSKYFTLKRALVRKKELLVVRDTITNITDTDLPVQHFHEIAASAESHFFLNSFPVSKSLRDFVANHNNASTFVQQKKSGLGLFPLDDVTRVHAENYVASETRAGLADRTLVLPPGKSITTEIALIPSRADYFDFLNILRRELEVNFTLKGSLIPLNNWWFYLHVWNRPKDRAQAVRRLQDIVKFSGAAYSWAFMYFSGAHTGIAIDSGNRPGHPRDYWESDLAAHKRLMGLLAEAAPTLKTSVYYHCFIDYWPEAEKWYNEDAVINAYGLRESYFRSSNPNKSSGIYLPTLTNKFGKACSDYIDYILKEFKPENAFFYWDEFSSCKVNYSYNPSHWDGFSGDIDPVSHKLLRKKSSLALASGAFRLAMVKKIKAAGEDVMVNSQPRLRSLMKEQLMSFTETAQIDNCARVQVYTPIQLGNHLLGKQAADPAAIYRQMLEGLDFGVLYYYYHIRYIPDHHTLTQYMFPITPMELHKGYIIGKEKIVTKVSGIYGWNDQSRHEVHVYDATGWPVNDFKAPARTIDGNTFTELRLPEDWSAVIIRK